MIDLLVIGAGLSGLMAAHTAAQSGSRVHVISKGLGALHWGSGTIDVLGYLAPGSQSPVVRPLDQLDDLLRSTPGHPYGLVDVGEIDQALRGFQTLSEELGLPYAGAANPGDNLRLPSPAGALRPVSLAPRAQLTGDLNRTEPMLIVGFKGARDFYPELIAENLRKQGYTARAAFLPLRLISDRRDSNPIQLAHGLDDPERGHALATELKKQKRPGERIGLPALLGMERHLEVVRQLETETDAPIFEIPTLPPSAPGMRLFAALRRRLEAMGVRVDAGMDVIQAGKASLGETAGKEITWVESDTSSRPLKHRARKFLLATGGVLGGGFDSNLDGRVWETIFDLPLTCPRSRSGWFRPAFLDPSGHPVFKGGVEVNRSFQPVDAAGQVLYTNLWVAGSLLAHCDAIQERSSEGVALVTGVAAGRAATAGESK